MARNTTDTLFRRRALFMLAGILLVVVLAHRPWILLLAFSGKGLTKTVLLVVAGLTAVIAIHELAQFVLRGRGEPWYSRRGADLPAGSTAMHERFAQYCRQSGLYDFWNRPVSLLKCCNVHACSGRAIMDHSFGMTKR